MTKWHIFKWRSDWYVGTRGFLAFPISYVFDTFDEARCYVWSRL